MNKIKLPFDPRMSVPFALMFLVLVLMLPRSSKFSYDYRKGQPWKYETLVAQFDFPIYKTDEQIQEEKSRSASAVIPYYRFSDEIVNKNLKSAEGLSFQSSPSVKASMTGNLKTIFRQGILSDDVIKTDRHADKYSAELIYIQKDKRVSKYPVSEVYKLSDAKAKLLALVLEQNHGVNVDSIFRENGVYDLVVPNLVFDRATTDLLHSESGDYISPTQGYVTSGQMIVSEGEIVTSEIAQMLDSYKKEYRVNMGYSRPRILLWLGNIIIALALILILYLGIFFIGKDRRLKMNSILYIMFMFLLCTVATLAVGDSHSELLYLIPFPLVALCLRAFFSDKTSVILYIICLIPLLLFAHDGAVLFVLFFTAGFTTLFAKSVFWHGRNQIMSSLTAFGVALVVYSGFRLTDAVSGSFLMTVLYLLVGELLSSLIYPSVFLLERVFNLVSDDRLVELANPDNKLLRELDEMAPGTFQHSLQVMNMADAAARSIGANVALVRAGALYHDIGKIANPQCFVENESIMVEEGEQRYHASLSPIESAEAIRKHVDDGVTLARERRLPQPVVDFILTHHGTGTITYFYNKFVNDGGDPSEIEHFRYHGRTPSTKEQIILMLCDSVEAASRTLKDNSPKGYSDLVEKIVTLKSDDGQFAQADISIKELELVKEALKEYLAQLFHDRVAYPKLKANNHKKE